MKYILVILSFFILGCSQKEVQTNRLEELFPTKKDTFINKKWWEEYKNQSLNRSVENSLKNSIEIKKGYLNIKKALYQNNISKLDKQLKLSGNISSSYSKDLKSGISNKSYGSSLSLSYELDIWGKLQDSYKANIYQYKASKEDLEALRLSIINQSIDNFLEIAHTNDSIKFIKKSLDNYKKLQDIIKVKYQYGKVSKIELSQTKQSIISSQNQLLELEITKNNQIQRYKNLQNIKDININHFKNLSLDNLSFLKVNLDKEFFVLGQRPDLKASELRLKNSFINTKITEKSLYPSISLGASISSNSSKIEDAFRLNILGGNIQINLPFLDYQRVKNSIKISKTQYNINKLDFEHNLTKAINELNTYYKNYKIQIKIYDNYKEKLKEDIKITKDYKLKYKIGKYELSKFLEAQNSAINSKLAILNQKYQILKLQNKIYQSMGGKI